MSSASSISEVSDEGDWLDMEPDPEEETLTFTSLFDDKTFSSASEMLAYCKQAHDFDFTATARRLGLDFVGAIKLVNFVRSQVRDGKALPSEIGAKDLEADEYLQPVLENDALLFSLDDVLEDDAGVVDESQAGKGKETDASADASQDSVSKLLAQKKELGEELEAMRTQFANYRLAVEETLDRRWGDDSQPEASKPAKTEKKKDTSDYYFESYSFNDIHETMLKDTTRTDAYRDFIYENKQIFKDKVVLDIGCGTGILSMFAAKAGAAQVIAVDNSAIILKAQENIFNNNLSSKITCLRGAIEEVVLPVSQVDIIVSEWMGYCLLYEAMLPSVLYARDKYLKPDGIMAPSSATMWIAPVSDNEYVGEHVGFWRDVYGFDMKAMQEGIYEDVRVECMPSETVCGEAFPFKVLDLHTVKKEDLSFTAEWKSKLTREVEHMDGIMIWFDNFFATSRAEPIPEPNTTIEQWRKMKPGNVAFSTGPFDTQTHWKQGLLLAPSQDPAVTLPAASEVSGQVKFSVLEENARGLSIDASWSANGGKETKRTWKMK